MVGINNGGHLLQQGHVPVVSPCPPAVAPADVPAGDEPFPVLEIGFLVEKISPLATQSLNGLGLAGGLLSTDGSEACLDTLAVRSGLKIGGACATP